MSHLQELFKFRDEDLAANKRGELSDRQRRNLRGRMIGNIGLAVFFVLGASVMLFLIFGATDTWVGIVIVLVIWLVAVANLFFQVRGSRNLMNVESPDFVVGTPNLSQQSVVSGNRTSYHYHMRINDQSVRVNNEIYQKLDRTGIYRLYYVPNTDIYLSIEHAQNSAASPAARPPMPPPDRSYLPDDNMDMELLIDIYMKEKPLVIPTTNSPAEDAHRQGEWFKAAKQLIRERAEEAKPYLENYPDHPLTTELMPDKAYEQIPALMEKVANDKNSWRAVQDQIRAMPQAGLFDAMAPYWDSEQPQAVRMVAVGVIGALDDPRRVEILREAVQSGEMNLYSPAIYWLGEAGEGADVVAPFLEDEYKPTRETAADALFKMGDPRGLEFVRERAYELAKAEKARAADELVKIITERRARRYLGSMVKSKNIHLQIAAQQAVKKLRNHDDETIAKWAQGVTW